MPILMSESFAYSPNSLKAVCQQFIMKIASILDFINGYSCNRHVDKDVTTSSILIMAKTPPDDRKILHATD